MRHAANSDDERQFDHSPERRLMIAVIATALSDAIGSNRRDHASSRALEQRQALQWFNDYSPDFQQVCLFAGYNPTTVRERALQYIHFQSQSTKPGRARLTEKAIRQFEQVLKDLDSEETRKAA